MEELIHHAKRLAQRSDIRHRHASVIFNKRGKAISDGFNKVHPRSTTSIHAEKSAIGRSIKSRLNNDAYGILIIRVSYKGRLKLSAPCEDCRNAINAVGLCIYYTDDDEDGNEYIIKEQSNGTKKYYRIVVVNFEKI